jgi:hypothetical protein
MEIVAKPCWHMRNLVHEVADDRAVGWRGWFARMHLGRCPKCHAALEALKRLIEVQKTQKSAPEDVIHRLAEGSWREELERSRRDE